MITKYLIENLYDVMFDFMSFLKVLKALIDL